MTKHTKRGFTLIELLIVVTIIGILTALTLGAAGVVQTKAAKSRAQAEIAAIELALERYKIDNGDFPDVFTLTPSTGAGAVYPSNPSTADYRTSGQALFEKLMGRTVYTALIGTGRTQYIELKPGQVGTSTTSYIQDPWGFPYGYYYNPTGNVNGVASAKSVFNQVVPDFWSTAGENRAVSTTATSGDPARARYQRWMANWPNK